MSSVDIDSSTYPDVLQIYSGCRKIQLMNFWRYAIILSIKIQLITVNMWLADFKSLKIASCGSIVSKMYWSLTNLVVLVIDQFGKLRHWPIWSYWSYWSMTILLKILNFRLISDWQAGVRIFYTWQKKMDGFEKAK